MKIFKVLFFLCICISLLLDCSSQSLISKKQKKYHNKIDNINSSDELDLFIKSFAPTLVNFKVNYSLTFFDFWDSHIVKNSQYYADSLNVKAWTKADFDGNGFTDILLVGKDDSDPIILCILDHGFNQFYIHNISRKNFRNTQLPIVTTIDKQPVIFLYTRKNYHYDSNSGQGLNVDTLIFKFGYFIEYHKNISNYKIEKIEFTSCEKLHFTADLNIVINSDRLIKYSILNIHNSNLSVDYDYEFYQKNGILTSTLDSGNYNVLINLLNYMDFPNLKNEYECFRTSTKSNSLIITYNNGQKKIIYDDCLNGTYGLLYFYKILLSLKKTQKWN